LGGLWNEHLLNQYTPTAGNYQAGRVKLRKECAVMKMTRWQRAVILTGVVLIIGMGLYPPWKMEGGRPDGKFRCCAHGFLFAPPQAATVAAYSGPPKTWACRAIGLDLSRLLVEWTVVVLATATVVVGIGAANGWKD